jgi:hypothetical protein
VQIRQACKRTACPVAVAAQAAQQAPDEHHVDVVSNLVVLGCCYQYRIRVVPFAKFEQGHGQVEGRQAEEAPCADMASVFCRCSRRFGCPMRVEAA